jgi:hypothetical protein
MWLEPTTIEIGGEGDEPMVTASWLAFEGARVAAQ